MEEEAILAGLSTEQKAVIDAIKEGQNVFMTGSAGSGKTYVINCIQKLVCHGFIKKSLQLCATTANAANNINGITFHRFAGIGLGAHPPKLLYNWMKEAAADKIRGTQLLIIDEISMMDFNFFTTVFEVIKLVRRNGLSPTGGIQLVLVGDFSQLPTIMKNETTTTKTKKGDVYRDAIAAIQERQPNPTPIKYLFQCPIWEQMRLRYIKLNTNYRQKGDPIFYQILTKLRIGESLDEAEINLLKKRELGIMKNDLFKFGNVNEVNKQIETLTDEISQNDGTKVEIICKKIEILKKIRDTWNHTCIFSHRIDVNRLNEQRVNGLPGRPMKFSMLKTSFGGDNSQLINRFIKNMVVPEVSTFKIGTIVKICINLDPDAGLYNGAIGTIKRFGARSKYSNRDEKSTSGNGRTNASLKDLELKARMPSAIYITLNNDPNQSREIELSRYQWNVEDEDGVTICHLYQFPIVPIYGTTLHQIQGATLPHVIIGDNNFFNSGMGYVALSRSTSLDGLNFLGQFSTKKIWADRTVIEFISEKNIL